MPPPQSIVWVSCASEKTLRASTALVDSFHYNKVEGRMFFGLEGLDAVEFSDGEDDVDGFDLAGEPLLGELLKERGDARDPYQLSYRMAACLRAAKDRNRRADALIWVSPGFEFGRAVTADNVHQWSHTTKPVFYLCSRVQGKPDPAPSVAGFRLDNGGDKVLDRFLNKYESGNFKKDARRDGVFQLRTAAESARAAIAIPLGVLSAYIVKN